MTTATSAAPFVPDTLDLQVLEQAARGCQGCELYADATQTVFGEGQAQSTVMLVGEQPGDVEDRRGEPFVGPAGKTLDRALDEAGIDRSRVYVTNAVKHFRFTMVSEGARRLHATPSTRHVRACRPWLSAELASVQPRAVVALGATAAQALLGPKFRVTQHRGEVMSWPPPEGEYTASAVPVEFVVATIHPSAVLRGQTQQDREELYDSLVADLSLVPGLIH